MNKLSLKNILIVVAIVATLPFLPLLFGYFPATGDMRDVFIPIETFFHTEQLRGNIPAWNPAVSFGFPIIAAAQIGFFYPVLFVLRFLPVWLELPLALISHSSISAIGMFLFARRFKLSKEASFVVALSFSLSQFIWQHLTHLNIFLAVAWFPWQMLAVDILFRTRQYGGQASKLERRGIIALIMLFGVPFLIGQIQVPFLMMAVALVYAIYLRVSNFLLLRPAKLSSEVGTKESLPAGQAGLGEVSRSLLLQLIIISLATFLLASVQLLPTLELSALSSRATPEGFDIVRANQHSYPLYHLPTYVFPRFYGTDNTYWGKRLEIEYGAYIGVIPLLLAVWYMWQRSRVPLSRSGRGPSPQAGVRGSVGVLISPHPHVAQRQHVPSPRTGEGSARTTFFIYLLIISFLLSLGDLSPFRLIGLEPSLWFFSAPARWLLFTTFSLSLFAGFGLDAVWEQIPSAKRFFCRISFTVIALVVLGNILFALPALQPSLKLWLARHPFSLSERGTAKIESMIASAKTSSISLASPYTYIALLSLIILPYSLTHKNGKKILLAITVLDLVIIAGTTTPVISWESILKEPSTLKNLPENIKNHNARIYSLRDGGDTGAYFTDPSSRADSAKRQLQKDLLVPMVSSQFGVYGIEWPASLDLSEQGAVLERLHPTKPYAVEDMDLASELTIGAVLSPTENGGVDIQRLESKLRFELLCDYSRTPPNLPLKRGGVAFSPPFQGGAGGGESESCDDNLTLLSEHPSELIFKTSSESDSTLIVRDTFYPGWKAYVDGNEVEINKSPLFFRSVAVPAGEHIVIMKYVPNMLNIGGIISLITLLSLVVIPGLTRHPRVRQ